ncbi:MAG: endo-1,4-beta-xylanase [Pirellulaceae bacterium]|nr:endo-1,4-beta-xylanase [Pirellulaceae bacterium]MDP6556026.1 endo-1,4-beta-xylanase [Pirellulaceae bacterium]
MGQMRFLVPQQSCVPDEALERAYLAGMEWIPWRGNKWWVDRDTAREFILERSEEESGNLYIPWQVDGFGELTLATASLMERDPQYCLDLELARGVVNRLRNQVAEWEAAGLSLPPEFFDRMSEASTALIDSVIGQADEDVRFERSTQAIRVALETGDLLVKLYTNQAFAARHEQVAQLPTMLGAVLACDVPQDAVATVYLEAANSAAVEVRWRDIEPSAGKFEWDALDQQLDWCHQNNLRVIAGPLLQIDAVHLPDWLSLWEDDFEQLQAYARQFIQAAVDRYKDRVQVWNCAARMNVRGSIILTEEQTLRLIVAAIEEVRRADPSTPAIISIDRPWAEYMAADDSDLSPLHFSDSLVRADLGLAGIGLELNLGYWTGGTLPRDVLTISQQIDRWSVLGLPLVIYITLPSGCEAVDPTSKFQPLPGFAGGATLETQHELAEQLISLLMAKPFVQGVIWNQLTDAEPSQFAHGGIFDAQGLPKPVLAAMTSLRKQHLI